MPRAIAWTALVLGLLALPALFVARFDDDPLNLRDPESPSVATLLDIIGDPRVGPYDARVLSKSSEAAAAVAEKLSALPEVARAVTLSDYLPAEQDDKLAIIEETAFFLTPLWAETPAASIDDDARRRAFADLKATAAKIAERPGPMVPRGWPRLWHAWTTRPRRCWRWSGPCSAPCRRASTRWPLRSPPHRSRARTCRMTW